MLWTQITNETENPLELNLNFLVEYEIAFFPGKYIKLLVPPDTMTLDKDPLPDYGLKEITSFIDNNLHKPSSLKRTLNPKESSGFYFLLIFDKGVIGKTRTGLSIKGQNLFYEISRCDCTREHSIWDKKEINCGSINLKNLLLKKYTKSQQATPFIRQCLVRATLENPADFSRRFVLGMVWAITRNQSYTITMRTHSQNRTTFNPLGCDAFPRSNLIDEKTNISTDFTSDFNFIRNYNEMVVRNCDRRKRCFSLWISSGL